MCHHFVCSSPLTSNADSILQIAKGNPNFKIVPYDEGKQAITPARDPNKEFLKQYDVDRCTVYVAHMPPDVVETELEDLFSQVGTIIKCTIVRKDIPSRWGNRQQLYAFVEYEHMAAPEEALNRFVSSSISS